MRNTHDNINQLSHLKGTRCSIVHISSIIEFLYKQVHNFIPMPILGPKTILCKHWISFFWLSRSKSTKCTITGIGVEKYKQSTTCIDKAINCKPKVLVWRNISNPLIMTTNMGQDKLKQMKQIKMKQIKMITKIMAKIMGFTQRLWDWCPRLWDWCPRLWERLWD